MTADVLLRAVPRGSIENVREAARGVLARSTPPMESAQQETGLVVGYVQSGKTMSFTTLAAMARDNRFRLVIAITGTSVPLFGQSKERLKRDLGLTNPNAPRRWHLFENPRDEPATARAISMTFADWEDASVPDAQKQAVLIVVMKQHQRLQALNQLLATLGQDIDLTTVPTLIIDDEADQASLNNEVSAGSQSTTYARLLELKRNIPFHTFLQYTATPQAPLLINMIDALSPGFADVLEPGPDYVGGRDFFSGAEPLVRTIPPQDIPSANNILGVAPESLLVLTCANRDNGA